MSEPRLDEARPKLSDPNPVEDATPVPMGGKRKDPCEEVREALRVERERAERQWEVTPTPDCNCGTCKALGRVRRAVLAEQEKPPHLVVHRLLGNQYRLTLGSESAVYEARGDLLVKVTEQEKEQP